MITQAQVQELFNYDPETGILTNKKPRRGATAGKAVGCTSAAGYLVNGFNGKNYLVHRVCFLHYHGFLPEMLDHVDNDRLNNRIINLRECTLQENNQNRRAGKNNASGVKGVTWKKSKQLWHAQVSHGCKYIHIGYFKDIKKAKEAIKAKRTELHGEFANHG